MSEINSTMNESLNIFFGITDKDMEDFNNIKISDENELNNETYGTTLIDENIKNIKQTKRTLSKKNTVNV